MRPDKIVALENDDYSRFGNNAYAKGFLLIYGRFLKVDVSDQVRALEAPNDIRVQDYQYLSNAPAPEPERIFRRDHRQKPSLAPLIGFAVLVVMAAFGFYLYTTFLRLGNLDQVASRTNSPDHSASAPASAGTPPAGSSVAATATPPGADPAETPASTTADPTAIIPGVPAPALESVAPLPVAEGTEPRPSGPLATAPGVTSTIANEVVVEASKKTWVKIHKEDPSSPPIFMDYLYPSAPPLKLRGARFFIEARDPSAIQIRKNGAPIAYQTPGVMVQ